MQQSSFPHLLDVVDNVFGVLQHYPPKFEFSTEEGRTRGVFGVPQHHPPKFGLSPWEVGTCGVFGVLQIILQDLGFLLGREGLPVFWCTAASSSKIWTFFWEERDSQCFWCPTALSSKIWTFFLEGKDSWKFWPAAAPPSKIWAFFWGGKDSKAILAF